METSTEHHIPVWENLPEIFCTIEKDRRATTTQQPWNEIVKRGAKRDINLQTTQSNAPANKNRKNPNPNTSGGNKIRNLNSNPSGGNKILRRPIPRTAVVTLTCPPGGYTEAMKMARTRVALCDLGITDLKLRRAVTGAFAFEIRDEDSNTEANKLADALRTVFIGNKDIKVARPVKIAEIRIRDLEESLTIDEIALAVATAGDCKREDVRVSPNIRWAVNGLGTAWIKCPLSSANSQR